MNYIVGDIQGCLFELKQLLEKCNFNQQQDHLYCCGDLVGRGPEALGVLQFLMQSNCYSTVLGNHDIFLIMLLSGALDANKCPGDLQPILHSPDCDTILQWLLSQPLLRLVGNQCILVHAGIPPQWSIDDALVINALWQDSLAKAEDLPGFLRPLWGNEPYAWDAEATLQSQLRYIINAFSRMRFCNQDGQLDFIYKQKHCNLPGFKPWFEWRCQDKMPICFGHWAMLNGLHDSAVIGLDTGCVYGGALTAYCLDDGRFIHVEAAC